ncbi:hypothetical protein HanIR_Chr16g0812961 [Helianthus annuus]|nr:hypothetical protein HanIR_Chr16g0812961 [Helianthus annuus]
MLTVSLHCYCHSIVSPLIEYRINRYRYCYCFSVTGQFLAQPCFFCCFLLVLKHVLRGTWGKVRREKIKWLELEIRSLNKLLFKF